MTQQQKINCTFCLPRVTVCLAARNRRQQGLAAFQCVLDLSRTPLFRLLAARAHFVSGEQSALHSTITIYLQLLACAREWGLNSLWSDMI